MTRIKLVFYSLSHHTIEASKHPAAQLFPQSSPIIKREISSSPRGHKPAAAGEEAAFRRSIMAVCLQLSRFSIMVPGPAVQTRPTRGCSLCIATFPRASANTSTCYTRLMPGLSGLRLTFPRTNGRLPWLLRDDISVVPN